jgi:hypothetical protein
VKVFYRFSFSSLTTFPSFCGNLIFHKSKSKRKIIKYELSKKRSLAESKKKKIRSKIAAAATRAL